MSTIQKITITEALAEIKLIEKKLSSKTQHVAQNLSRAKHLPDPLGDSAKALQSEMQSIHDLYKRQVKIRGVIAKANIETTIRVIDDEMSITEWLAWKREVSAKQNALYATIRDGIKAAQNTYSRAPQIYKDSEDKTQLVQFVFNLDYQEYVSLAEKTQEKLDKLDGLLSLKNATILVEV